LASRRVAVLELGDADGTVVVYVHGVPGCRLDPVLLEPVLDRVGLRVVAIDRPGYRRSDPAPGRGILDWPDDVAAVADALDVGPLMLLSFSAGTPFLLGCCIRLADRVTAAASVSGLAPPDRRGALDGASASRRAAWAVARHPLAVRLLDEALAWWVRARPGAVVDHHAQRATDGSALEKPSVRAAMVAAYREALAQGGGALAHEHHLAASPWGFSPADVQCPVRLWHGEKDALLRPVNSEWLAAELPLGEARIVPGAGHFVTLTHGEEIARDLLLASAGR